MIPRCRIIPRPHDEVSFQVDGRELTRWCFGSDAPRPFFYPLNGPASGESLTRMGHPGAPDHDHHRSVWFAHHKLLGIDFWGIKGPGMIRQRMWQVYEEGEERCRMAVLLDWVDGHDPQPLVEQQLVATVTPLDEGEYTLSLDSTFLPRADQIEFQQTNFGFLAVRVAKSLSAHFGGGELTSSGGAVGEPEIFGKPWEWVDYSGPMPSSGGGSETVVEGITYFDHPSNPDYPAHWHVRADGWMGASACFAKPRITTRERPLMLRYLLHIHRGKPDAAVAQRVSAEWKASPMPVVRRSTEPHRQFEIA